MLCPDTDLDSLIPFRPAFARRSELGIEKIDLKLKMNDKLWN